MRSAAPRRSVWVNKDGDHIKWILLGRLLFSISLVFLTWNPSGYSYVAWAASAFMRGVWEERGIELFALGILGILLIFCWLIVTYKLLRYVSARVFIGGGVVVLLSFVSRVYFSPPHDVVHAVLLFVLFALFGITLLICFAVSWDELKNLRRRLRRRQ